MAAPIREVWSGCPFCFADVHDGPCGTLVAHLPGKHNQKDHGKSGKGAKAAAGTPADMHSDATIRGTYNYHDSATGMTASVDPRGISGGNPDRATFVTITVTDRNGNVVGGATRTIHPARMEAVDHSSFNLNPDMQGQGFATRYNAHVEQSYRDHGIKQIELHAGGGAAGGVQAVGGYAWARAGYDFASPASRGGVARAALAHAERAGVSAELKAEISRVASNPAATPADFAMIGHKPGASTWAGKEIMLGNSAGWDGVKKL